MNSEYNLGALCQNPTESLSHKQRQVIYSLSLLFLCLPHHQVGKGPHWWEMISRSEVNSWSSLTYIVYWHALSSMTAFYSKHRDPVQHVLLIIYLIDFSNMSNRWQEWTHPFNNIHFVSTHMQIWQWFAHTREFSLFIKCVYSTH